MLTPAERAAALFAQPKRPPVLWLVLQVDLAVVLDGMVTRAAISRDPSKAAGPLLWCFHIFTQLVAGMVTILFHCLTKPSLEFGLYKVEK